MLAHILFSSLSSVSITVLSLRPLTLSAPWGFNQSANLLPWPCNIESDRCLTGAVLTTGYNTKSVRIYNGKHTMEKPITGFHVTADHCKSVHQKIKCRKQDISSSYMKLAANSGQILQNKLYICHGGHYGGCEDGFGCVLSQMYSMRKWLGWIQWQSSSYSQRNLSARSLTARQSLPWAPC